MLNWVIGVCSWEMLPYYHRLRDHRPSYLFRALDIVANTDIISVTQWQYFITLHWVSRSDNDGQLSCRNIIQISGQWIRNARTATRERNENCGHSKRGAAGRQCFIEREHAFTAEIPKQSVHIHDHHTTLKCFCISDSLAIRCD